MYIHIYVYTHTHTHIYRHILYVYEVTPAYVLVADVEEDTCMSYEEEDTCMS